MNATDELRQYRETHPISSTEAHHIKLLLEAIREGGITQVAVEGITYEVYADILETKE